MQKVDAIVFLPSDTSLWDAGNKQLLVSGVEL